MLKEREYTLEKISIIFQVILSLACFSLVWWFQNLGTEIQMVAVTELKHTLIFIALLWFLLLEQFGLGRMSRRASYVSLSISYFKLISIGSGFLFAINVLTQYEALELTNLFLFSVLNLFVLSSYKNSFFLIMRFFRRRGYSIRQILVIADKGSEDYIERIIHTKDWGYNIRGIMTGCDSLKSNYQSRFKVIPERKNLKEVLDRETIDEVIYCKTDYNQDEITRFILECAEVGISFHHYTGMISKVHGHKIKRSSFSLLNQLPFVTYMTTPDNYAGLKLKSAFDFFFSLFVVILISPVFLLIAIAIKLDDGGPIFFRQERVGLNGRRFSCFKFRTMVANAEALKASLMGQNEQDGPVFKISMDPRVTRVGRFLRKTSLDELPQFFNVLRGEMSVVGPRPPIPAEVEKYKRWQIRRLSMKPGITCIWQVSGRNDIPFEEWMKLDMQYIDNWSLFQDAVLILRTVKVMLVGTGK
ncbi:sugar transferase [Sunxiuqinia elliptica]|uniref:Exopolysaccharide biosynthesis polyprenyl glycosylphosphotransferase n=1 Tax=Sunxiuqinia elliptica TaxID=655355 RepID=A0A1I2AAU3_9BACT|nr:sugar transferase [Sunxiuqinia elliptica]SFE40982.1 exopolysaccharide biosynthesis polyprenyl glycosylphosphotransferase [Sunxiuqinia elliptica]